ncbi:hypothetical protein F0562_013401 [Nyssa sinensis]|uniref:Uncharacterized protein n=1 Tax=Nyssa sinensis TaxID=561372 RepID=A0A5J4ZKL1_9ASTE|nr:hypothetical protein F0562_013401 [Nyssa sinensis]
MFGEEESSRATAAMLQQQQQRTTAGRENSAQQQGTEPAARQYKEDLGRALFLYVGSHLSQLEPAWEDMELCKTVAVMI